MTTFLLAVDCDNDAFQGTRGTELARILRDAAHRIETHGMDIHCGHALRDANGNGVGMYRLTEQPRADFPDMLPD